MSNNLSYLNVPFMEKQSLKKTKFAEYVRDFTAIGNPFLLLLVSLSALSVLPGFEGFMLRLIVGFLVNEFVCSSIKYFWHKPRPNGQVFDNGFEKIDARRTSAQSLEHIRIIHAVDTKGKRQAADRDGGTGGAQTAGARGCAEPSRGDCPDFGFCR